MTTKLRGAGEAVSKRSVGSATRQHRLRLLALGAALGCAAVSAPAQGAYNMQPAAGYGGYGPQAQEQHTQPPPKVFVQTCTLCHGGDARGTDRAPTLVNSAKIRGMSDADVSDVIHKGRGKMPAFPLPPSDIEALTHYVRSLNTTTQAAAVPGDPKAGEGLFFGEAQCSTCHIARGRGSSHRARPFGGGEAHAHCRSEACARRSERKHYGWLRERYRHAEGWKRAAWIRACPAEATIWRCNPRTAGCISCWTANTAR